MKKIYKIILFLAVPFLLSTFYFQLEIASAQEVISDWTIRDFQSEIVVNKDSSLDITEKITADCGNLPGKHGIFRVLPTKYQYSKTESVKTPITLLGITNFSGTNIAYTTINDRSNHTVTWKIGDANKTVTGLNYYQIHYKVDNAIRFKDSNFDEFYWNIVGAFWDIDIEKFSANITFPTEITKDNSKVWLYSGKFKNTQNELAQSQWQGQNILNISTNQILSPGKAVTSSITFPKNILTPYKFGFWQLYGQYFWLLIPIISLIVSYSIWYKEGRDPKINSAIAPEFEIPENLDPLSMGLILTSKSLRTNYLSATIIDLAVKKYLVIEELEKKSAFAKKDYALILKKNDFKSLSFAEQQVLKHIFSLEKVEEVVRLSSLENKFYLNLSIIGKSVNEELTKQGIFAPFSFKNLFVPSSTNAKITFGSIMYYLNSLFLLILLIAGIFGFDKLSMTSLATSYAWISILMTIPIALVFLYLMPKLTLEGATLLHRIKGFKMYMETAEKYRQQFNEKENIFEKFLPYAIMFGLTKLWIKKMQSIYGKEYFSTYHPYWFYGAGISNFDVDSFASHLESLSSGMASSMASSPSSSGSGGGGFSGGGGGGGGGGGW